MGIGKEFLEMIVCPKCKGDLQEKDNRLLCAQCGVSYKIVDGIPVLLAEEAEPTGNEADR